MMVFDSDIQVLDANLKGGGYTELKEYELKLNKISDAKLNADELLLGIACSTGATPEISLYETREGFAKLSTFYGFGEIIKAIDFSTDGRYLHAEDRTGKVHLWEVQTSRPIAPETVTWPMEWLGEGLRTYRHVADIRDVYSEENKILNIIKVPGRPIIAIGDEIGTVRLYNYPNDGNPNYYQCYTEHLYNITKCVFTNDLQYFVSISSFDKCVFKWKMTCNPEKVKKYNAMIVA